jgi:DNA-binding XRE family transcriptional regulator
MNEAVRSRIVAMSSRDRDLVLEFLTLVLSQHDNPATYCVSEAALPIAHRARLERAESRCIYWLAAGERLRQVRQQLGLSELEAAQNYGVHVRTYRRYERGGAQRHKMGKLVKFADKYNLSLDWLFEAKGTMFMGGFTPGRLSRPRRPAGPRPPATVADTNVIAFPRTTGGAA